MPNSPAIQSTSQRRYPTNAEKYTPTQSPKSSNLNLARIRQRVPHKDLLGIPKFDSQTSTPPIAIVAPMLETSKTIPTNQRLAVLTMREFVFRHFLLQFFRRN
jgi:hypothetical protein